MFERIHREEWARLVAALARRFGDLDLAEEAAAEAFALAVEHWRDGPPPNPGGWLMTTANRRAIDRLRRERRGEAKLAAVGRELSDPVAGPVSPGAEAAYLDAAEAAAAIEDDRLRLIAVCCHPALAAEARIPLTLRLVAGLTVAEIARCLLLSEAAVAQRITRAKAKIAAARLPFRLPEGDALAERIDGVLSVIYLIYTSAYLREDPAARDLAAEAERLARLVHRLAPRDGEATGLLALILLTDARRAARSTPGGGLIPLAEQDRDRWDRARIAEAIELLGAGPGEPGRFALQAALAAVHARAPSAAETDWAELDRLYRRLRRVDPGPVVALNHAVVIAELEGPAEALALVDALDLDRYHPWHVTRADLLARLGRHVAATDALDRALALGPVPAQAELLRRRRAEFAARGGDSGEPSR